MQPLENHYPTGTYEFARRRETRSRRLRVILSWSVAFLVLLCIIGFFFWLFKPDHLNKIQNATQIVSWIVAPSHLVLIGPWLIILLVFPIALAIISGKPTAIVLYVLDILYKERSHRKLYTMLSSLDDVDQAPQNIPEVHNQDVQPNLQKVSKSLLILGLPGAGKTKTLLAFQYDILRKWWKLFWNHEKIPVYVQMNSYNLYLKNLGTTQQGTLVNYVVFESASAGVEHLRPYLEDMLSHGQVVLLFDGVNEVDSTHLPQVCNELRQLIAEQRNRIIVTCRDIDFREQEAIQMLAADGYAQKKFLLPLRVDAIEGFIERYIDAGYVDEDKKITWRYTAQEIKQKIDQTGLSQYCTNPLILYTMMRTINGVSIDREVPLNTRGLLLREFVSQLIEATADKPKWRRDTPKKKEIVWLLSEIACNARRINARNAIRLVYESPITGGKARKIPIEELAGSLPSWLENPNSDPDISFLTFTDLNLRSLPEQYDATQCERYLRFAREATLIKVDDNGEIRFRHELIAEYFVGEYLNALDEENQHTTIPFIDEILENQASWSQPLALWAGLLPEPVSLARRLADYIQIPQDPKSRFNKKSRHALALSLTCIGVIWTLPHSQQELKKISLPENLSKSLRKALPDEKILRDLAPIIRKSAEEGGIEIYHSLLPLLATSGPAIGKLFRLTDDPSIVPLLFDYLKEIIDKPAYEKHREGTIQALGQFGKEAIHEALQLSSSTTKNIQLRIAAIRILGYTREQGVVEPLITFLRDDTLEQIMVPEVIGALSYLHTEFTLEPLSSCLEDPTLTLSIKVRVYSILNQWLERLKQKQAIDLTVYERIIELVMPFMEAKYPREVQTNAMALLLSQVTPIPSDRRWENVIKILLLNLSTDDIEMGHNIVTTIKRIGKITIPQLRDCLSTRTNEIIRLSVIEILKDERPIEALPDLLQILGDASPKIQEKAKLVLKHYAPESIPGLIQQIRTSETNTMVVYNAADVLKSIGKASVGPITQILAHTSSDRVRVLVQVLVHIHDREAVPAIIDLLEASLQNPALALFLVENACSQFADERIVIALLNLLKHASPSLKQATSKALSLVGSVAFPQLFAALDIDPKEISSPPLETTAYIREALISMKPFPMPEVLEAFASCSTAQAWHFSQVFLARDEEAAAFLVQHLCNSNSQTREYVHQTADKMKSHVLLPPLLDTLQRGTSCPAIATYLLKFPESIPQLVQFLGNPSGSQSSYDILIKFGPRVISFLIPALEETNQRSLRQAKNLIVAYTQQDRNNLFAAIRLFSSIATQGKIDAREALLDVLVHDLADSSIEPLLDELRTVDIHIRDGVSDALTRLVREDEKRQVHVKDYLLQALHSDELRGGAEATLIKMKDLVVSEVWQLVTDREVGESAQHILSEIGAPSFHVIWAAYSNMSTPELREAARNIFRGMATTQIKDDLIHKLVSEKREDTEMAFTLLTERIHDDMLSTQRKQEMIPALLDYVQSNKGGDISRRILAFLLLQQKSLVIRHMVQGLQLHPQHSEWLMPAFLILDMGGTEAKNMLHALLQTSLPPKLLAEINSVLGMVEAHPDVVKNATNVGHVTQLAQQEIALHALGGLLVGGKWNAAMLQSLRNNSHDVTIEHELFSLLLGIPYAPRLKTEQFEHQRDVQTLSTRIKELEQNISMITQEKEYNEQQVRRLEGDKTRLTSQWRNAQLAKTTLEVERDNLHVKVQSLETQVVSLTSENQRLRRRIPYTTQLPPWE